MAATFNKAERPFLRVEGAKRPYEGSAMEARAEAAEGHARAPFPWVRTRAKASDATSLAC